MMFKIYVFLFDIYIINYSKKYIQKIVLDLLCFMYI